MVVPGVPECFGEVQTQPGIGGMKAPADLCVRLAVWSGLEGRITDDVWRGSVAAFRAAEEVGWSLEYCVRAALVAGLWTRPSIAHREMVYGDLG